ncbi:MAG TPA: ABC-type transport auxiliary lipoprotein family protein [Sphingomonas sp.]|jgi:cholesterol transport system auxiliary component|uniref:ABC-type transport auxiliary lipoprotein family protein n=1 Tax=Sphingomonas sp. TaxID=28214 RepID=UPI002EDA73CE
MRYAILLLAAPLAGCISFGAAPPPSLLTIETTATVPVGPVQRATGTGAVTVAVPSVPQALATARVPVRATPTTIAYVKDAQWAEPPARLFARLLADTITAGTGRLVLSTAQSAVDPGARLSGEIRRFDLDATTREAVVTFDASLIRGDATQVEKRRFEARVPVTAIDAANAGSALGDAANRVATQVAEWVGR